jgi:hypothetical protein
MKTYTERAENTEEGTFSISASGSVDVPSNNIGKSEGNSSSKVCRTALSCSCACNIKSIEIKWKKSNRATYQKKEE